MRVPTNVVDDAFQGSLRCLVRVLEMLVIPPKQAFLTVVLSIPYCRARHLNDP